MFTLFVVLCDRCFHWPVRVCMSTYRRMEPSLSPRTQVETSHTHTPLLIDMFTNLTPSQHSAPSHAYRTCTFPLTTSLTHMCTYLTPSHHSLLPSFTCAPTCTSHIHTTHYFPPSVTQPSLTCSPASHPHTITH